MKLKQIIKKIIFKKTHEVLPKDKVRAIQKKRLEGGLSEKHVPESYKSTHTYSVVSAVYNCEKYLNDFFVGMTSQTMDLSNLKLIMVDDGSTDNSALIIKSWQTSFPELITYIHKENGGQSSARNLGLEHVATDWVTFVDADDYVSQQYFEEVDRAIKAHPDLRFVTCRIVFNNETKGEYFDRHPLRGEFKKEISLFNVTDDFMPITLAVNKSFFRTPSVEELEVRFDERVKPDFEDAHFLNRYLLLQKEGRVAYLRKPIYYYRKREDGTSTLDGTWQNPDKITTVLKRGKLDLLKFAKETKGYVPFFIQKAVLYDLHWYFKHFTGHEERSLIFLKMGLGEVFWGDIREILNYIDTETIWKMPGSWLNFEKKHALVTNLKGLEAETQYVYIDRIDYASKLMLIRSSIPDVEVCANGKQLKPVQEKRADRMMLGSVFYSTYFQWLSLPESDATLSFSLPGGNADVSLSVQGKRFLHKAQMKDLNTVFKTGWSKYAQNPADIWIFMDRDTQADDNAEHLYRWVKTNHPEQSCFFVLRKEAADWQRLSSEGFELIAFGSKEHEKLLRSCSTIVSSHADGFVHSYFGDNFLKSKRFVFLQHGVIHNDLSSWLNNKPIDLMLTSAQEEYDSITQSGSSYNLTPRQVLLSGLPRHDSLLKKTAERKSILIMPTWRNSLCGVKQGQGNIRKLNPHFGDSLYKQAWESLLNNKELQKIAEAHNLRIVFYPHTNTYPYIENGTFSIPDYIVTAGNQAGDSIQQAFADAQLVISDYSSIVFETAFLKKPCIYFQFDKDEFFSGMQVYSKGYFDYEHDGFGPVAVSESEVISAVNDCAKCGFIPEEKYAKRMEDFFPYRDGKCCERAYNRIKELSNGSF